MKRFAVGIFGLLVCAGIVGAWPTLHFRSVQGGAAGPDVGTPLAWWQMTADGTNATQILDFANSYNASNIPTVALGPTLTTDGTNYYYEFDGLNDRFRVDDPSAFSFTDGSGNDKPFSLSMWLNSVDWIQTDGILSKYGAGTAVEWSMIRTASRVYFYVTNPTVTAYRGRHTANDMPTYNGDWIHVVGTYDGSETTAGVKIYINGTQADTTDFTAGSYTGMTPSPEPVLIGNRQGISEWEGFMDDVRIFATNISATVVSNLYTQGQQ